MSGFFAHLVDRAFAPPTLRPRPVTMFEESPHLLEDAGIAQPDDESQIAFERPVPHREDGAPAPAARPVTRIAATLAAATPSRSAPPATDRSRDARSAPPRRNADSERLAPATSPPAARADVEPTISRDDAARAGDAPVRAEAPDPHRARPMRKPARRPVDDALAPQRSVVAVEATGPRAARDSHEAAGIGGEPSAPRRPAPQPAREPDPAREPNSASLTAPGAESADQGVVSRRTARTTPATAAIVPAAVNRVLDIRPPAIVPRLDRPRPPSESPPHIARARAETTVHVSIGRIEVRAIPEKAAERRRQAKPSPVMSLNDYLNARSARR